MVLSFRSRTQASKRDLQYFWQKIFFLWRFAINLIRIHVRKKPSQQVNIHLLRSMSCWTLISHFSTAHTFLHSIFVMSLSIFNSKYLFHKWDTSHLPWFALLHLYRNINDWCLPTNRTSYQRIGGSSGVVEIMWFPSTFFLEKMYRSVSNNQGEK